MQLKEGNIDGRQIISAQSVREMHKPAMVDEPSFAEMAPIDEHSGFAYGLGWGIYHYKGHEIIEKGGARLGMRSIVVLVPDKKLGIVVLANQNLTVLPEAVRAYLMEKMVEPSGRDLQADIRNANHSIQKMFANKDAPAKQTAPISLPLEKYVGKYENRLYGFVDVYIDQGKLRWQAGPAKISGELDPVAYDTFLLHWPKNRIALPENVTFNTLPR
jgi:CubicO group peptidase (beta-lactamase class C family)